MKPAFEKILHKNTIGSEGAVSFQVETDPAIMKRLSDDVYEDPISAIIRELSTNAYDAHIDAGTKHKPFDIKLPTEIDQMYKIRDYGTGISKENLLNTYTRYASSTRRNSNNHIGSIGIGSKSPFAYTSQFSVVSYFGGEKIVALCYKDENHMPYMQILDITKSQEPTGLEVYFPINKEDIESFHIKATKILQWFEVKPNLNIKLDFSRCATEQVLFEEKGSYSFFNNIESSLNQYSREMMHRETRKYTPLIVMGQVCYNSNFRLDELSNLILYADIGDVDINLNRESIQDNPKNRAWINKKIKEVRLEMKNKFEDSIKNSPLYEALLKRDTFVSWTGYMGTIQHKNTELPKELSLANSGVELSRVSLYGNRSGPYSHKIANAVFDSPIIFADIKNGYIKSSKAFLSVNTKRDPKISEVSLIEGDLDKFCSLSEYPKSKISKCSDYYKRTSNSSKRRVTEKILLFDKDKKGVQNNASSKYWKDGSVDIVNHKKNTGKELLYVLIDRYKIQECPLINSIDDIENLIDFTKYDIIGVKLVKSDWIKTTGVQSLNDALKNKSLSAKEEEHLTKVEFTRALSRNDEYQRFLRFRRNLHNKCLEYCLISQAELKIIADNHIQMTYKEESKYNKLIPFDKKNRIKGSKLAEQICLDISKRMKSNMIINTLMENGYTTPNTESLLVEGWKHKYNLQYIEAKKYASLSTNNFP